MFEQFGYINLIGSLSTRYELQGLKDDIQNFSPNVPPVDNSKIIYYVTLIVGVVCSVFIALALIICFFKEINIIKLIFTNIITIIFIALTDIFIVLFFSIFKVIQPGFLVGIVLSGNQLNPDATEGPDCARILRDGLDQVFPAFKSLIDKYIKD